MSTATDPTLTDPTPTSGDAFWAAFKQFLAVTPEGLTGTRAEEWADLFPTRLAFEGWRERWLAYLMGLRDGPTTREQYDRLRFVLFTGRARNVDSFHSRPPLVHQ